MQKEELLSLEELFEVISTNTQDLTCLYMSENVFPSIHPYKISKTLKRLAKAVNNNTYLEQLEIKLDVKISKKKPKATGIKSLVNALNKHPTLEKISVRLKIFLSHVNVGLLQLSGSNKVTSLLFQYYTGNSDFYQVLTRVLDKNPSISTLELCDTRFLSFYYHNVPIMQFIKDLLQRKNITSLCLKNVTLDEKNTILLLQQFPYNNHALKFLKWYSGYFDHSQSLDLIPRILGYFVNLQGLDLSYNFFTSQGFKSLMFSLKKLTQLTSLNLNSTGLDEINFDYLVKFLTNKSSNVEVLSLSFNKEIANCYELFSELIVYSPALKRLLLNSLNVDDRFVKHLAPILVNKKICRVKYFEMNIKDNYPQLSLYSLRLLEKCALINPNLMEIYTSPYYEPLNLALKQNRKMESRKTESQYIKICIEIAAMAYPLAEGNLNNPFNSLANELILMIMVYVGQNLLNKGDRVIDEVAELILENFSIRKEIAVTHKDNRVELWWSCVKRNGSGRTLFSSYKEPVRPTVKESCLTM